MKGFWGVAEKEYVGRDEAWGSVMEAGLQI